jgi:hypothetical protein
MQLKSLMTKAKQTSKFSDFLAVLNFINNTSPVKVKVGKVKINAEKN